MEKVQAGSLTEEFSFSRALHLMKNNNAKVRSVEYVKGEYLFIKQFDSGSFIQHTGCPRHFNECMVEDDDTVGWSLLCEDIMGNWTLYDERIHG